MDGPVLILTRSFLASSSWRRLIISPSSSSQYPGTARRYPRSPGGPPPHRTAGLAGPGRWPKSRVVNEHSRSFTVPNDQFGKQRSCMHHSHSHSIPNSSYHVQISIYRTVLLDSYFLFVKGLIGTFNKEKALVGTFFGNCETL